MKRSEVVLKIAECLVEPHHNDPEKEANYILKKLEKAGLIKPPDYFIDGWDDRFDEPCKIRRYGWEPEDNG